MKSTHVPTLLTSTAALGSSWMRMSSADTLLLSFFVSATETEWMINNHQVSPGTLSIYKIKRSTNNCGYLRAAVQRNIQQDFFKKILQKRWDLCELTGVRMEKSRVSVKLCEAGIGVDSSDMTVTFRLILLPLKQRQTKRSTERCKRVKTLFWHTD